MHRLSDSATALDLLFFCHFCSAPQQPKVRWCCHVAQSAVTVWCGDTGGTLCHTLTCHSLHPHWPPATCPLIRGGYCPHTGVDIDPTHSLRHAGHQQYVPSSTADIWDQHYPRILASRITPGVYFLISPLQMYGGDLWLLIEGSRCSAAAAGRYPAQTLPPAHLQLIPSQHSSHIPTHIFGPIFLLLPDLNVNLGL